MLKLEQVKLRPEQPESELSGKAAQLLRIPIGGSFRIDERVRPENRELFVKIGCMFIQEGHTDYDFNDTFTTIRHHEKAEMEPKRDRAVKGKPWQKVVQRDQEDAGKV